MRNKTLEGIGVVGILLLIFCLGGTYGAISAENTMKHHCDNYNALMIKDKLYECKLKEGK